MALLGLLIFAGYVFAFWMWVEALMVPGAQWRELCHDHSFFMHRSKSSFFIWWYVGGFCTAGLVPILLSIDFYRELRPKFRAAKHTNAASSGLNAPASEIFVEGIDGAVTVPPGWYGDPAGRHQHRFWNGLNWTENVANDGISAVETRAVPAAPR